MAAPAEVVIGPFENTDGSKVIYPLPLRLVNFWVSWSEDPGDAFGPTNLRIYNLNGWIPNLTQGTLRPFTYTLLKRIDNRFLFQVFLAGNERYMRLQVPGNVFNGNATTNFDFLVNTYNPRVRSSSVPPKCNQPVTSRNTTVTMSSGRGRPSYFRKEGFSLEGIVNGAFYSSRDAITSLTLPRTNEFGGFAQGANRDFTVNIALPDRSKGTVRVRLDKFSVLTQTAGRSFQLEFLGRGPVNDYLTEPFNFDTTATTVPALDRGVRGTSAIEHAENSEILLIDEVLDITDPTRVIKPIDELQWRTDERNLYNQIKVIYGEGDEYVTQNPLSVFQNGAREFTMQTPLAKHQTHWVRWIAQNLLNSFGDLQYIATLQLKLSLHLKLGQTILLRGLPQDDINAIVQIVGIEHSIAGQHTLLTVRTVKRATPQSSTAPVFSTAIFSSGDTITIGSGSTYNERLVAFGNPTPTISTTGDPSWLNIDAQGNISGTAPNVVSSSTVTFTATNGVSPDATFTLTFNVVVANRWGSGRWGTFRWGA